MVAGLRGSEAAEWILALVLAAGLLLYVGYWAVRAHRRTMAFYVFMIAGGTAVLILIVGLISGWDGRSLIRMGVIFVLFVGMLHWLWVADEDLRGRG